MKPKYKIGTFVQYTNKTADSETGIIEAQVIHENKVNYLMVDADDQIAENDIINAYRPIVARKPKAAKKTAAVKKTVAAKPAAHVNQ